ncbi:hypothetical protein TNCV_3794931 [Trichonephila clavipes]|nr:hypothetical protein TNCV_3794931 [Trichonephila clavipes]
MTLPSKSTLAATVPSSNSVPSVDTLFTLSLLLSTPLFFGQSRLKCLSDPQVTLHSSENEEKIRHICSFISPTRQMIVKLHMKKVLFFSLETAAGQFLGSTWSST